MGHEDIHSPTSHSRSPSARVRLGFPRNTSLGRGGPGVYWAAGGRECGRGRAVQGEVFITRECLGGSKRLLMDWRLLLL